MCSRCAGTSSPSDWGFGAERRGRFCLCQLSPVGGVQIDPTVPEAKTTRLKEKIATLRDEIERLNALNARMMASEDKRISLTDPDARSTATSGKGSGCRSMNGLPYSARLAHELRSLTACALTIAILSPNRAVASRSGSSARWA
jgi:hypothetical protein